MWWSILYIEVTLQVPPFHLQCIYKDTVCYLTPLVCFITDYSSPSSSAPSMGIYSSRHFCVRVSDRFKSMNTVVKTSVIHLIHCFCGTSDLWPLCDIYPRNIMLPRFLNITIEYNAIITALDFSWCYRFPDVINTMTMTLEGKGLFGLLDHTSPSLRKATA